MSTSQSGERSLVHKLIVAVLALAATSLSYAGEKDGSGLLIPLLVWFLVYSSPIWGTVLVVFFGIRLLMRWASPAESKSAVPDFPETEPASPPAPYSDAEAMLMLKWGITPDGGRFRYGGRGFETLSEAILLAEKEHKRH